MVMASNDISSLTWEPLGCVKLGSANVNPGPLATAHQIRTRLPKSCPWLFSPLPFQPSILLTSCLLPLLHLFRSLS